MTAADHDSARAASALRRAIADAVARLLVDGSETPSELTVLSPRARVDGVEVFDGDIKLAGERFEGLVNVHCIIEYGGAGGDAFETSQTSPGVSRERCDRKAPPSRGCPWTPRHSMLDDAMFAIGMTYPRRIDLLARVPPTTRAWLGRKARRARSGPTS